MSKNCKASVTGRFWNFKTQINPKSWLSGCCGLNVKSSLRLAHVLTTLVPSRSCCWGGCGNVKRSPVRGNMSLGWPWSFYSLVLLPVLLVPASCMLRKCDQPASLLPLHLHAPVAMPSLLWRVTSPMELSIKTNLPLCKFLFGQDFCLSNRKVN